MVQVEDGHVQQCRGREWRKDKEAVDTTGDSPLAGGELCSSGSISLLTKNACHEFSSINLWNKIDLDTMHFMRYTYCS